MGEMSAFICEACGEKCILIVNEEDVGLPETCPWDSPDGTQAQWKDLKGVDE